MFIYLIKCMHTRKVSRTKQVYVFQHFSIIVMEFYICDLPIYVDS